MDKWSFGITMTLIGMGGTFLTLGIMVIFMDLLKKIFPLSREHSSQKK